MRVKGGLSAAEGNQRNGRGGNVRVLGVKRIKVHMDR
jgi:hypothetical protein